MKIRSITIILILIVMLSSNVYAFSLSDMFSQAESSISIGKVQSESKIDTSQISNTSSTIYNIFLAVGIGVALIVGAILGIQFMTAGIDKKVKVQESLVAYVISCAVLFGAYGIWKLAVTLLNSTF